MTNTLNQALKAVLPHVAKPHPSLAALEHVMIKPGYVLATDRYTVAKSTFTALEDQPAEVLLPKDIATAVSKAKAAVQTLTVDSVTLTDGTTYRWVPGEHLNYPSVERFLDDFRPATTDSIRLGLEHLEKIKRTALVRDKTERRLNLRMEFNDKYMVRVGFSDHFHAVIATNA